MKDYTIRITLTGMDSARVTMCDSSIVREKIRKRDPLSAHESQVAQDMMRIAEAVLDQADKTRKK
jgi:hypothetical protein